MLVEHDRRPGWPDQALHNHEVAELEEAEARVALDKSRDGFERRKPLVERAVARRELVMHVMPPAVRRTGRPATQPASAAGREPDESSEYGRGVRHELGSGVRRPSSYLFATL